MRELALGEHKGLEGEEGVGAVDARARRAKAVAVKVEVGRTPLSSALPVYHVPFIYLFISLSLVRSLPLTLTQWLWSRIATKCRAAEV